MVKRDFFDVVSSAMKHVFCGGLFFLVLLLCSCGNSVSSIPPQFQGDWIVRGQRISGDSVPFEVRAQSVVQYEMAAQVTGVTIKSENQITTGESVSREGERSEESRRYTLLNGGKELLIDGNAVKVEKQISKNVFTFDYVPTSRPPRRLIRCSR